MDTAHMWERLDIFKVKVFFLITVIIIKANLCDGDLNVPKN